MQAQAELSSPNQSRRARTGVVDVRTKRGGLACGAKARDAKTTGLAQQGRIVDVANGARIFERVKSHHASVGQGVVFFDKYVNEAVGHRRSLEHRGP